MRPLDHIIQTSTPPATPVELDKHVYRKEVIYPSDFVKKDSSGRVVFDLPVDDSLLDHWEATFADMKANGIEVPLPIEHTTDPEKRRGTVIDLKKEFNPERGVNSLYAYVKFRDAETAASLSKTSQVSLYSPPQFIDGTGKKYIRPIRHLAITDYPLIPKLDGWQSVRASIVLSEDGVSSMTIQEIMDRLGISYPDGSDEETLFGILEEAWNSPDEPVLEEDPVPKEEEEIETDPEEEEEVEVELSAISAPVVKAMKSAREARLDALVSTGKITPAQKKTIADKFASTTAIAFALSNAEEADDGFDSVVASFEMNRPLRFGEKTSAQHDEVQGKSPIIINAEKRAAKGR